MPWGAPTIECGECGSRQSGFVCSNCQHTHWPGIVFLFVLGVGSVAVAFLVLDAGAWRWTTAILGAVWCLDSGLETMRALVARTSAWDRQVRDPNALISSGIACDAEILTYVESPARMWDVMGRMLALREFETDRSLGLVHGKGAGHALVRVAALRDVIASAREPIRSYSELVRAFRRRGYAVRRVSFLSFE